MQLLESGRQNPETRKLGLDMLRQLSLHHDYLVFLVQEGYYLEALRYVRKHKVNYSRINLISISLNHPKCIEYSPRKHMEYFYAGDHSAPVIVSRSSSYIQ